MNDNFTFLIFTYHNVFHSLLAPFRLRKWRLLALVSSGCCRIVTCVLSFTSAFPNQRRWVMIKTNFQPKIGLKQPNALTQRSQPSIWVEKTTQRFLECMIQVKKSMEDATFVAFCYFIVGVFSGISKFSLLLQRNEIILPQVREMKWDV